MLREDQVCPGCGALTTPQLPRCRQCGRYLHGTQLEGWLVEALLPKRFAGSPGTALVATYCILTYVLMVLLAGPDSLASFRPLALLQLGSTVSTEVQDGELWRFVTANFAHGSLLHILFNLYALSMVGPVVERLHDRRRLVVFFLLTGAISMVGGYAIRQVVMGEVYVPGSVGASGAISGLLGIAWVTTRGPGAPERELNPWLTRWLIILMLWGVLPRIDWIAHLVGLLAGVALGWLVPPGAPDRRWKFQAWTSAAMASLLLMVGSSTAMLVTAKDQPYRIEDDFVPRSFLFLTLEGGTRWEDSGQVRAFEKCSEQAALASVKPEHRPEALDACEFAIRVLPMEPGPHLLLSALLNGEGDESRARRQAAIAARLQRQ